MIRAILWAILAAGMAFSQATRTATLVGTVTDSTGAAIAGAKLTVINTKTEFKFEGTTNAEGSYYVPYLPSGDYELTIEASGFKVYKRSGIQLRVGESPRINVQMELGAVTESISVTATAPLLETETSLSGAIMENRTFMRMPVLQMRTYNIMSYLPGVNNTGFNAFSVIGQRSRSMGYTIDGVTAKEPVRATSVSHNETVQTSTDALQEVKLMTTGVPAEFGRAGAGGLIAVFKSGTNEVHGSLEDRYINQTLLHRRYFDSLPQTPISYHEMAATAGGPIFIPKLYDGRNKTFFFFAFQQHNEKASETAITKVPTPDMLNGDFSFNGLGQPIYDPASTRQDASGKWVRDPFPDKKVPLNRFDPVAKNFLAHNPFNAPNQPGYIDKLGPNENLQMPTRYRSYRTRFDWKIDHQFTSNHKIFSRYSWNIHRLWSNRTNTHLAWEALNTEAVPTPTDQGNAVISDTYTLNPTTINEFRLGYNRRAFSRIPNTLDQGWAGKLGIPNVSSATFPSFSNIGFAVSPGGFSRSVGEDFTVSENLTKVIPKHTFKMGYELFRSRYDLKREDLPAGSYTFGGTDMPFTPNTGNNFAAFLLGSVTSANFTSAVATWLPRWWSHGLYFQDDWKPIRNLTLNIGVRWSYESPYNTKYGQQAQFDPNATDPLTGKTGAIVHRAGPLASRDLNNFQPRVGWAYTINPKVVFRGNFGIMTQDLLAPDTGILFEEYFANASVSRPTGDPRVAFYLSQGPGQIRYPVAADGTMPFVGTNYSSRTASWYDPNMHMPYIMNWSGGVQYEFRQNWLLDVTYQGSAGVGLLNAWDINAIPLNISSDITQLDKIYQATQNYKPYPQFGSITHWSNYGHNTYHGATARVEKRYSSGVTLNAFYTFSKNIDDVDGESTASGITFYNRSLEKGRSGYDVNHRFIGVFQWELPFGKDRAFLNSNRAADVALGGWNLSYIQTIQSGLPFTVTFAGSPNKYLPGSSRPNILTTFDEAKTQNWSIGPNRFPTAAQNPYLNMSAFAYPAAYTPGTLGRNTFSGPTLVWQQASLSKTFPIHERVKFTFRVDVNKIFKNPSLGRPNSTYDLRSPGNWARFTSEIGNFAEIGSRFHYILVARLEF